MRAVIDTNIIVSGLLTPAGLPRRIVDLALEGDRRLVPLFDERVFAEYRQVWSRRSLKKYHLAPELIESTLDALRLVGESVVVPPSLRVTPSPDPKDTKFVEVAVAGGAEAIITGNAPDFAGCGVRVLSAREALRLLGELS